MPRLVQNAQVRGHFAGEQAHVGQVAFGNPRRQFPGGDDVAEPRVDAEVALQAHPVLPTLPVQPLKQRGGRIEAIRQPQHRHPVRQPSPYPLKPPLLAGKPDVRRTALHRPR